MSNENILLKKSGVYEVDDLEGLVPNDEARYHLFRYSVFFFHHNHASPPCALLSPGQHNST